MPANTARRGGKKGRKLGRNKKWCEAYQARGQREFNKALRLLRHTAREPHDHVGGAALVALGAQMIARANKELARRRALNQGAL